MRQLRRQNVGTEVRHELSRHPGAVAVLKVPSTTEIFEWAGSDVPGGLQEVTYGVVRLEGHPDAESFGQPGTPERRAFVDAMDILDIGELTRAVSRLARLTEDEAKN